MTNSKSSPQKSIAHPEAGVSLLELMIAASLFVSGMVIVMGNVVTASNHSRMSDMQATAATFHHTVLETMRDMDLDTLLSYEVPVDDPETNTLYIPGFGTAEVNLFAVVIDPNTQQETLFEIGVDDPSTVVDPPNPLEIQVQVTRVGDRYGDYEEFKYRSSTLVSY